jgi:hypothetical protein
LANPVPVTVIVVPLWLTVVIVGGSPIGTNTVCDPTLPLYGLLITSKAPSPSGALAGMSSLICVAVAPGFGNSGPRLPTDVKKFTPGLLNPVPPIVTSVPG